MTRPFLLLAFLTALGACTQNNQPADHAASVESEAVISSDTLCFQRYSGLANQDTASVKLIIYGNEVRGQYTNLPHGKDSRVGTIAGIKKGDLIKGMWYYQQEGTNDSLGIEFKLQHGKLLQKQTGFDRNTGREFLSDTASFSLKFVQIDCKAFHFSARRN